MPHCFWLLISGLLLQTQILFPDSGAKFDHITLRDGLSSASVTGVVKDEQGLIWVATRDGLNLYDGLDIEIFKPGRRNSMNFKDGWIQKIAIDNEGMIWLGTYNGGVFKFNPKNRVFTEFSALNSMLLSNRIFELITDHRDRVWIGMEEGLQRYDPLTNQFTTWLHEPGNPQTLYQSYVSAIHVVSDEEVWIGYWGGGVSRLNPQLGEFTHLNMSNSDISSNFVRSIIADVDGHIWVGTAGGLNRIERENLSIRNWQQSAGLTHESIREIHLQNEYKLWIATDRGLTLFDIRNEEFTQFYNNPVDNESVSSGVLLSVMADRNGRIWVGSLNKGVSLLDPFRNKFSHIKYNPLSKNSISHGQVKGFSESRNGDIWIATWGGLTLWQRDTNMFHQMYTRSDTPNALPDHRINSVLEDNRGNVWIGTWGDGLYHMSANQNRLRKVTFDGNVNPELIRHIFQDSKGTIWVATFDSGLFYSDPDNVRFTSVPVITRSGPDVRLNRVFEDNQGNIWVAGYANLSLIRNNKLVRSYTNHLSREFDQPFGYITSILQDISGNIWIGTNSHGICKLPDVEADRFNCVMENDGLPNNTIQGILSDNDGYLWITTGNGMAKFHPVSKEITSYSTTDGLQDMQYEQGAYYKTVNGDFLFGGINGFNVFRPEQVRINRNPPNVVIRDMKIISKADSSAFDGFVPNQVTLRADENFFTISFNAIDYTSPQENLYQYKMEGLDGNWSAPSNLNFATYTNVPHGSYSFRVRAANSDGVWNEHGQILSINIVPPFWQERWFIGLAISAVMLVLLVMIQYRERSYKTMKEKLEHMVGERTESIREKAEELSVARKEADKANLAKSEFLAGISHELRTPLNAIIGFSQILNNDQSLDARQKHYVEVMQKSGKHLLEMINDVLDISKIESGQLEVHNQHFLLHDMLVSIVSMFSLDCQKKGLDLEHEMGPNLPNKINADVGKIRQILINMLGNAVKFTDNGNITIHTDLIKASELLWLSNMSPDKDVLYFKVSDSGRGIAEKDISTVFEPFKRTGDQRNTGTGLGLTISRKLIETMGGSIRVESKLGRGSVFEWAIPFEYVDDGTEHISSNGNNNITGLKPAENYIVLTVDDNRENADLIRSLLQTNGMRCYIAATGEKAIEMYGKLLPDLVLMDINLPGIDGVETAKRLREITNSNISVIAVTAGVFNQSVLEDKTIFDGFILKPFEHGELLMEISRHLDATLIMNHKSEISQSETIAKMKSAIDEMPEEMRIHFLDALELSDFQMMSEILESVGNDTAGLGILKGAVNDREYTLILNLSESYFS